MRQMDEKIWEIMRCYLYYKMVKMLNGVLVKVKSCYWRGWCLVKQI